MFGAAPWHPAPSCAAGLPVLQAETQGQHEREGGGPAELGVGLSCSSHDTRNDTDMAWHNGADLC